MQNTQHGCVNTRPVMCCKGQTNVKCHINISEHHVFCPERFSILMINLKLVFESINHLILEIIMFYIHFVIKFSSSFLGLEF